VPRVIGSDDWRLIEAGVVQRVRALNEFVCDAYGDRRIVAAGIVPLEAIRSAEYFEPDLVGTSPPGAIFTNLAGLDLVRAADDRLLVLEDNVRSPSGIAFALAARRMSDSVLPFTGGCQKVALDSGVFDSISAALNAAAPEAAPSEPSIALVSDGTSAGAWFEHRAIAEALGCYLFKLDQLEVRAGAVYGRDDDSLLKPIDVIYRRTDLDRLRMPSGAMTQLGRLLLDPIRQQKVACVNAFGAGIADDKLIQSYVEQMISFYLDEEPLLASVKTWDPADPETLDRAAADADRLVFKPRGGLGGAGVTIGAAATGEELEVARRRLVDEPGQWVVQERVALSTHPTIVGDALEPRHIDLRPYAIHLGERAEIVDACLSRVAMRRGGLIVNSSQNGGAKDTWVVAR
jgi:uncharacterized circularly permuted ATP-grasp superfamily protein